MKNVVIYTDGACSGNPGPGGYGAILCYNDVKKEISGGYRLTTNNRMELLGAIAALSLLKEPCTVTLYSDSRYLVDAIEKGWAIKWKKNGWMRTKTDAAVNPDLWERLLDLLNKHEVVFKWVKGHADNPGNERCDELARQAISSGGLLTDSIYEKGSGKS